MLLDGRDELLLLLLGKLELGALELGVLLDGCDELETLELLEELETGTVQQQFLLLTAMTTLLGHT